ncbi:MAG: anaerobic glycerol-3-phosphate dehydrogenase subunit C, partial [Bacteroidales bacterium]|nr:anaerobic glycerol-3-phosphate dehydrogenase subunit C [Bacteroidales bacterium]
AKAAYHCPCHQERLGLGIFTTELLKMIPGMELTELESNCCGIAGTYGFKKENFKVSQMIGRPLFDSIAAAAPEFVACECETCKWQIEMSTGVPVKNPVSIIADALDLEKTSKLNCG